MDDTFCRSELKSHAHNEREQRFTQDLMGVGPPPSMKMGSGRVDTWRVVEALCGRLLGGQRKL